MLAGSQLVFSILPSLGLPIRENGPTHHQDAFFQVSLHYQVNLYRHAQRLNSQGILGSVKLTINSITHPYINNMNTFLLKLTAALYHY